VNEDSRRAIPLELYRANRLRHLRRNVRRKHVALVTTAFFALRTFRQMCSLRKSCMRLNYLRTRRLVLRAIFNFLKEKSEMTRENQVKENIRGLYNAASVQKEREVFLRWGFESFRFRTLIKKWAGGIVGQGERHQRLFSEKCFSFVGRHIRRVSKILAFRHWSIMIKLDRKGRRQEQQWNKSLGLLVNRLDSRAAKALMLRAIIGWRSVSSKAVEIWRWENYGVVWDSLFRDVVRGAFLRQCFFCLAEAYKAPMGEEILAHISGQAFRVRIQAASWPLPVASFSRLGVPGRCPTEVSARS